MISCVSTSDIIAIVDIVINAILAIIIIVIIQKKMTTKRVLKDYFINEIKTIQEEYSFFIQDIIAGKQNAKSLLPWFKIMNMRISRLEKTFQKELKIKPSIHSLSTELQISITETDEFNDSFKEDKLSPSESLKALIYEKQKNIFDELVDKVVEINRS